MSLKFSLSFWGLFLAILFFSVANPASAQQAGRGIGLSPLNYEITANPGDTITNEIKVFNPSQGTIGVKMEIEDFAVEGEEGRVKLEPAETETYSIAQWLLIDPLDFVLAPGEQKMVSFTITVPQSAEPGGHYGSILASTRPLEGGPSSGAGVASRVGALVLLSVTGQVSEGLTVKDFTAPLYSEYGPINFSTRFENSGSVHVKPRGFITITNWLGQQTAVLEIPQRNVLPNSIRKIEVPLNAKRLWAGKYTATLTVSYGSANNQINPIVISFWAFPWKDGVKIAIAALAVMVLLILTRKRWFAALRIIVLGEKR